MIDANILVRSWLLTPSLIIDGQVVVNQVPVVLAQFFTTGGSSPNNTSERIYGGHLIPGFDPLFGPGIVVRVGGGTSAGTGGGSAHPDLPLNMPRMQLTAWAGVNQYDIARQLYGACFDWMHGRNMIDLNTDGFINSCVEQVEGQDVDDPHTGLATVAGFWSLVIRRN
jgi:hypothetical protein